MPPSGYLPMVKNVSGILPAWSARLDQNQAVARESSTARIALLMILS
jgi:hypothetical protein